MKSAIKYIVTAVLFLSTCFSASSQNKREEIRLDLNFGARNIHRAVESPGENLDFLNYLNDGNGNGNFGVLSFGISLSPDTNWSFYAGMSMLSDMLPSHMLLDVKKKLMTNAAGNDFGISGSMLLYPQYINEFNQYHYKTDIDLIADVDKNYRQINLYDLGFSILPYWKINKKRTAIHLATGAGIFGFLPFNQKIAQKKPNANFRRELIYQTSYSPALVSLSRAELSYILLRDNNFNLGIQVKTELLLSYRSLKYKRTINTWTTENSDIKTIKPRPAFYSKAEGSVGLYLKF